MYSFVFKYRAALILIVALIVSAIPLLRGGFPLGHDFSLEIVRLVEYQEALITQIFPRFAPDLYMGYGSPIFVFYPPFFLFFTSTLSLIGIDLVLAIKILVLILGFLGAYGFYQFLKAVISKDFALIGALMFIFTPYKFVDLFSRNAFAEYTAFMLFPLVLWGIMYALKYPGVKSYCMLFITVFLFSIAHNISVMLAVPFIGVLFILFFKKEYGALKNKKLLDVALPIVFALGSAMYFLLPALFDGTYVQLNDLTVGKFEYGKNFLDLQKLFFDKSSLIFITPIIVLIPFANLYAAWKEKILYVKNMSGLTAFIFSLVCFCMMFSISENIWKMIPILHLVQFPWRFMLFFSVFALWNTSYVLEIIFRNYKKTGYVLTYISICILAGAYLQHYNKWDYYTHPIPTPAQIAVGDQRTTVGDEYLNSKVDTPAQSISIKKEYAVPQENFVYQKCLSDLTLSNSIVFPLYYFPYWKAYSEGKEIAIDTSHPLVTVPVSVAGCVEIRLEFTQYQKLGFVISILSFSGFLLWIFYIKRRTTFKKSPAETAGD